MLPNCPSGCGQRQNVRTVVRFGYFYRSSDRRKIQRFKCAHCGRHFSQASFSKNFGQNKRHLNRKIFTLLVSGVSQRRISQLLKCHLTTVSRKLAFLGQQARWINHCDRLKTTKVNEVQFDDLETFEHTKLKPLSITLMVAKGSRQILAFEVARMPAKGLLTKKSLKKYGPRRDERPLSRERLFRRIRLVVPEYARIESDQNPSYFPLVKSFFPKAHYQTCKGQRGAVTGQGELKKVGFDPLFSLNHTCAMFRANVNRLFRKTWCTTKKIQPLIDHLELYALYHNRVLLKQSHGKRRIDL